MKGIIVAGGLGTRLGSLTQITNKHLLPVFDRPMIEYPIRTLTECGIEEIMIVVSGPHAGHFLPILKNGEKYGLKHLEYAYQEKADGGIADALSLAETFANGDKIAVILGDNTMDCEMKFHVQSYKHYFSGAQVFLKKVSDPRQFGCPKFNSVHQIEKIEEKPSSPDSNYAVIGFYLYDNQVFDFIREIQPSSRGQLEISSVNNKYIENNLLTYRVIEGFWQDAGTPENLFLASQYWYNKVV